MSYKHSRSQQYLKKKIFLLVSKILVADTEEKNKLNYQYSKNRHQEKLFLKPSKVFTFIFNDCNG